MNQNQSKASFERPVETNSIENFNTFAKNSNHQLEQLERPGARNEVSIGI